MAEMTKQHHEVAEAKSVDWGKRMVDGQKADVLINTGQLGKTFVVKVTRADGRPALIAVHL